jgi:pSer/pThr/pTyr-binding forkhead associated (FHA) protein
VAEDFVPLALVDARSQSIIRLRKGMLLVGRSSDCGLILVSEAVSRRHAELAVSDGEVRVRDLGSRNGTFLNDEPVEDAAVAIGDRLKFGLNTFVLQHVDDMRDIEEPETRRSRDDVGMKLPHDPRDELTEAQKRVYALLIEGKSEKEAANKLQLSQNTVHSHVQAIYAVFGVHTRAKLMALAVNKNPE